MDRATETHYATYYISVYQTHRFHNKIQIRRPFWNYIQNLLLIYYQITYCYCQYVVQTRRIFNMWWILNDGTLQHLYLQRVNTLPQYNNGHCPYGTDRASLSIIKYHYQYHCWVKHNVWIRFIFVKHGPLARYLNLRVAHAPGMPGTFSPTPRVSDPDMHHGTCVTHLPRCMSGSLTSGSIWSRSGKRSRHSRRMLNPQFYVSSKRPIVPAIHVSDYVKYHLLSSWSK